MTRPEGEVGASGVVSHAASHPADALDEPRRRQAELEQRQRLIQTDRLAAIGQLAAGIAHEINNPAAFVALNLQHLARTFARVRAGTADAATLDHFAQTLEDTAGGVRRIVATVDALKLFARIPEGARSTPIDVNELVRSAITLTRGEIRGRARLVTDLDPALPLLPGDHALLGQVCVNLLLNAAQAVPRGTPDEHEVRIETRAVDDRVRIRVSDTGAGLPPELLPHIFDPMVVARSVGHTGLGLAISADAVRRMGGMLDVESVPQGGTRFTVELPVVDVGPVARDAIRSPHGGRILVVEDEEMLALAMVRQLERRFTVVVAPDATSALQALASGDFAQVFCDVGLPDLAGTTLFERAVERTPTLATRFVFVTGDALDPALEALVARHGLRVLEKPFDPADLDALLGGVEPASRRADATRNA
jgi:nitrogen-specific signal transduction histidine kinase/CheY-like chemotaxis protein